MRPLRTLPTPHRWQSRARLTFLGDAAYRARILHGDRANLATHAEVEASQAQVQTLRAEAKQSQVAARAW